MSGGEFFKYLPNTLSAETWKRVGIKRRAGVLVTLFSVYSEKSSGIGDFSDLSMVADWCQKTGLSILQLLPLNECGSTHCPYDSLSSFALEPAYLSLTEFEDSDDALRKATAKLAGDFNTRREHLDYSIKERKLRCLWDYYCGHQPAKERGLEDFKKENAYWLEDFSFFKVIKSCQESRPWYEWEEKLRDRDPRRLEEFRFEHRKEIDFQQWLQWQLYKQLKGFKAYAAKKGVLVKGDLPILVSRDSADVWAHRELFKLEFAAGAPPDMYCAKGQRWGMPTYNWQNIAVQDFLYIKEKLKFAANFYDMLRIDHVVGLFRIWSIPYQEPQENKGLNGAFDPQDDRLWGAHGRDILSMLLKNSGMLLCAEDLGIIPAVCTQALREFGVPGNDVQRWVKDWDKKHDFLASQEYRSVSVAMLSTHDTTNWPAWWKYEAGTVDEALFMRKCNERGIDYNRVKELLFDPSLSKYGRLRWRQEIDSQDKLISILQKDRQQLLDFIDLYENSYREKEKLWGHLGLSGPMREEPDKDIVAAALKITLGSSSIFCVETIIDWLYLADLFAGDPYRYRINTPGSVSPENWSETLPLSLEALNKHKVCAKIKKMVSESGRI